jgi:hypothetical protein
VDQEPQPGTVPQVNADPQPGVVNGDTCPLWLWSRVGIQYFCELREPTVMLVPDYPSVPEVGSIASAGDVPGKRLSPATYH